MHLVARRPAAGLVRRATAPCALVTASSVAPTTAVRTVYMTNPVNSDYPGHYNPQQKLVAGHDVSLRMTEFYDGFTDDFGVFKEGAPATMRLEYVRAPEHLTTQNLQGRYLWSPFESGPNLANYSPFYRDYVTFSSRDYFGHRSGTMPGDNRNLPHYQRKATNTVENRVVVNNHPQPRVPKWLACIVHHKWQKGLVGFFLYANGAYAAELLSHKQLPRLTYNKPHLGYLPTIGQRVQLSEVTFGKEVHSVQPHPSAPGVMCNAPGVAAVVLRGSEPNLVPLLLPSKEVRLFDSVNYVTFGRRAGLMYNQTRIFGREMMETYWRKRSRTKLINTLRSSGYTVGGGNDMQRNNMWRRDWRVLSAKGMRSKTWLSGYVLRGRHYNKNRTTSELKARTWGWDARDPLYR